MSEMNIEAERAAFEVWAGIEYRHAIRYTATEHDIGWRAWKAASRSTPPSPSTAPIAEDELRAAAAEVLKRWNTPLWRQEVGTAALMNRLRAALASRPAVEVEAGTRKIRASRFDGEVELPPLPPKKVMGYDAFDMAQYARAYGQECARAALASKPAARDKETPCGS